MSVLVLVATVTRNARSGDAVVTMVALLISITSLTMRHFMSSYTFGLNLFLMSRHSANRDKPFTRPASERVKDNRT